MLTLEQQQQLQQKVVDQQNDLELHQAEIKKLKWELAELKRRFFGSSSERISDEQLELALAQIELEREEQQAVDEAVKAHQRRKLKNAKPRIPEHLEVVTEEIIPEEVAQDPEAFQRIGEEVTEELDIIPTKFIKRLFIRPKFVPKQDRQEAPLIAALPPRVVPGGIPSARLIAFLIVSKYCDHLPLYRLEKIFKQRYGVPIARQRMCDWIAYAVKNWLSILYRYIRQGLLEGDYLQIDETPIRYLDSDRKGKSHNGYFWVYGRPKSNLCFDWKLGRSKEALNEILETFAGLLQSDGYKVYDSKAAGSDITQLGCWAHARRRFFEAFDLGELEAARYILPIRQLYELEKNMSDDPQEILNVRQQQSQPLLEQIKQLLDQDLANPEDTKLYFAIKYTHSQWNRLTEYINHPQARIDNNLTEQAIRPTKLGAKNWLFIGHPQAGDVSAIIYSLVESCKRQGVEPLAYLTDVLERLPQMNTSDPLLAELTPDKWKIQQTQTAAE